jgi:hypothetical protein
MDDIRERRMLWLFLIVTIILMVLAIVVLVGVGARRLLPVLVAVIGR